MRFTTARLCGGEALMAISADILDIDLDKAERILKEEGCTIKEKSDMLLVYGRQAQSRDRCPPR